MNFHERHGLFLMIYIRYIEIGVDPSAILESKRYELSKNRVLYRFRCFPKAMALPRSLSKRINSPNLDTKRTRSALEIDKTTIYLPL